MICLPGKVWASSRPAEDAIAENATFYVYWLLKVHCVKMSDNMESVKDSQDSSQGTEYYFVLIEDYLLSLFCLHSELFKESK